MRLDAYLVEKGFIGGRDRAKEAIKLGRVTVNGGVAKKASLDVTDNDKVELFGEEKYVGRGGLKLEGAINAFGIDLGGATCLDIGASTGGFCDCMLQNGAKKVYAVDVGTDQLAEKLKNDLRVVNMEKTDIRAAKIGEKCDFISIDVSFISLKAVLPCAKAHLKDEGSLVALIKPQFEAGRAALDKRGVVRDEKIHLSVVSDIVDFAKELGFGISGLTFSPVRGGDGNIEYLIYLKNTDCEASDYSQIISEVVHDSHKILIRQ